MSKAEIRMLNGYRLIYMPEHPRSMKNNNWIGYIYEHIEVAEKYIGRQLLENEIVHHLDFNRANNRIENLLILDRGQHSKLHAWIDKGAPILEKDGMNWVNSEKPKLEEQSYCTACGRTLQEKQKKACSIECASQKRRKIERPTKKSLELDIKSMSFVKIGEKYGVSDNAIRKWARAYDLTW